MRRRNNGKGVDHAFVFQAGGGAVDAIVHRTHFAGKNGKGFTAHGKGQANLDQLHRSRFNGRIRRHNRCCQGKRLDNANRLHLFNFRRCRQCRKDTGMHIGKNEVIDHHLWRNGRLLWIAMTVESAAGERWRVRRSLKTADIEEARRRRDELIQRARGMDAFRLAGRLA